MVTNAPPRSQLLRMGKLGVGPRGASGVFSQVFDKPKNVSKKGLLMFENPHPLSALLLGGLCPWVLSRLQCHLEVLYGQCHQ